MLLLIPLCLIIKYSLCQDMSLLDNDVFTAQNLARTSPSTMVQLITAIRDYGFVPGTNFVVFLK